MPEKVKGLLAGLAVLLGLGIASAAFAQQEDCSQIVDPDERAACEERQGGQ